MLNELSVGGGGWLRVRRKRGEGVGEGAGQKGDWFGDGGWHRAITMIAIIARRQAGNGNRGGLLRGWRLREGGDPRGTATGGR